MVKPKNVIPPAKPSDPSIKLNRLVIQTTHSNTSKACAIPCASKPEPSTRIAAAAMCANKRCRTGRPCMSSSKETTNSTIMGNTTHQANDITINAQADKRPAINPTPPMRGIGSSCNERSLGISWIFLPALLNTIIVITNIVISAAIRGA